MMKEYPVERTLRDYKIAEIGGGTTRFSWISSPGIS